MGIAKSFKPICEEIHTDVYFELTSQEIADELNKPIQEIRLVPKDLIKNWATKYRILKRLDEEGHSSTALYKECELMFTGSSELIDLDNPGSQSIIADLMDLSIVTQSEVDELIALKYNTTTRAKQLGYNKIVSAESVQTCLEAW